MMKSPLEFFYLGYLFTIIHCNNVKTVLKQIDLICFDDNNLIGVNCEIASEVCENYSLEVIGVKGKFWTEDLKNDKLVANEIIEIVLADSSSRMPRNIGVHFFNLKNLIIHNSSLQFIARHDFKFIERVEKLQLYNNRIANIDRDSFHDLINLEYLDLDKNFITKLHPELLKFSPKLEVFTAANNDIKTLHINFFEVNHKIRSLNIRSNKIQNFDFITHHREKLVHLAFINIKDNGELCSNFLSSCEVTLEKSKINTMMQNEDAERDDNDKIIPILHLNASFLTNGMLFKNIDTCASS